MNLFDEFMEEEMYHFWSSFLYKNILFCEGDIIKIYKISPLTVTITASRLQGEKMDIPKDVLCNLLEMGMLEYFGNSYKQGQ